MSGQTVAEWAAPMLAEACRVLDDGARAERAEGERLYAASRAGLGRANGMLRKAKQTHWAKHSANPGVWAGWLGVGGEGDIVRWRGIVGHYLRSCALWRRRLK